MFSAWKMGSMWHMPKWSLMCIQFKKLLRTHSEERVSFTNLRCQSWEISQGWNQKGLWLDLARTTNCDCWWSISKSFDLKRARASGVRRLMTLWLRFLESWLVRALIWSPSLASNQTRVQRNNILQRWWWSFWNLSSIGWRDEGIPIKTKEISSQVRIKQRIKQRFRQRHWQRKSNKQEGLLKTKEIRSRQMTIKQRIKQRFRQRLRQGKQTLIWLIIHVILIVFEFRLNWYQSIKWMRLLFDLLIFGVFLNLFQFTYSAFFANVSNRCIVFVFSKEQSFNRILTTSLGAFVLYSVVITVRVVACGSTLPSNHISNIESINTISNLSFSIILQSRMNHKFQHYQ